MKKTITRTELTDDIDGSKAEKTVRFAVDGKSYEIDLNARNAKAFNKALTPYVEHARKTASRRSSGSSRTARRGVSTSGLDLGKVREWATQNGYTVAERGRISSAVITAYREATSS